MSNSREETALSVREESTTEIQTTRAAALAQHEIQSAIAVAKRFPRNEDAAFGSLMRMCKRSTFAEQAEYRFPRGGSQITGPSVHLARAAAQAWGNMQHGVDVISDAPAVRTIRAWAWDVESNLRVSADDTFAKLIYRKAKGWVEPDERDLRELTNRRGAILVRNCILQIIPSDLVEDAVSEARKTQAAGAAADPDGQRKAVITSFDEIGVSVEMLEQYLGHTLASCAPDEIVNLRGIYKSIRDGNSKWSEYVTPVPVDPEPPTSLKDRLKQKAEPEAPAEPAAPSTAPDARESLLADVQTLFEDFGVDPSPLLKGLKAKKLSDLTEDQLRQIVAESATWQR